MPVRPPGRGGGEPVAPCGCDLRRRGASVVVNGSAGIDALPRPTGALARVRDFSDNGRIAFATVEASHPR